MTAAVAPLRLLRCPEAIPDRQWLLDNLLWADSVGAIWPNGQPTPRTPAEQQILDELEAPMACGLFQPERIVGFERFTQRVLEIARSVREGEPTPWSEAHAELVGPAEDDRGIPGGTGDLSWFLYAE
jgi:hypothetical protein